MEMVEGMCFHRNKFLVVINSEITIFELWENGNGNKHAILSL